MKQPGSRDWRGKHDPNAEGHSPTEITQSNSAGLHEVTRPTDSAVRERNMTPDITLELAYRVARLIDQGIPLPEIAVRTGLTEEEVGEVVAGTLDAPDLPPQVRSILTATEALVLRCILTAVEADSRAQDAGVVDRRRNN